MATMSNNWDSTTEVLRGRAGMLTRIALLTLVLPPVVRDGWIVFAGSVSPAAVTVGSVLAIIALLVAIWGQLAIAAVALDPATSQGDATRIASRRFVSALGVYAVACLVIVALMVPIGVALAGSNIDLAAMSAGQPPSISAGTAGFLLLYGGIGGIAALFVAARLFVLNPVIVAERQGLRAFARSWAVTRGLTWRIIGVMLLFGIVWIVATAAARSVLGIVLRLALGAGANASVQFFTAAIAAALAAAYMVVVSVFATRLYVTQSEQRAADLFS